MKIAIFAAVALSLCAAGSPARAQMRAVPDASIRFREIENMAAPYATRRIGLGEALGTALDRNTGYALARAEEGVARGKAASSYGALLPSIELSGFGRERDGAVQGSFGDFRDVRYDTYTTGVAAVYRINLGERIHHAIASRLDVSAATLRSLRAEQQLLLHVTELYQRLALTRIGVQVADGLVNDGMEFHRIAAARERSGLGLGAEVARAEAELASDRRQFVEAERIWRRASVALAEALQLDPEVPLEPGEDELRILGVEAGLTELDSAIDTSGRPDVVAAHRKEGAATHKVYAAWWDLLGPDLRASWDNIRIGDDRDELSDRTDKTIFLNWTVSLEKVGRIKERRAEKRSALLEVEQAGIRSRAEVESARQDMHAALDQIPLAGDGLAAAERSLDISRSRYEAGTAMALEVLDAQDTLARARLDIARSIVAFNLAKVRFLAATGLIDRNSLEN